MAAERRQIPLPARAEARGRQVEQVGIQPGNAAAGDGRPVEQVVGCAQGRCRPRSPCHVQTAGRQGREIEPAAAGRGENDAVAEAARAQLESQDSASVEHGVALLRRQGQGAEPAVLAGQAGGERASQRQRRAAGRGEPAVAAEHGAGRQLEKAGSGGRATDVAEQQGAGLHRRATRVAVAGVQTHRAGTVERQALGPRDRHLQVQQGPGRGLEAVVGPQSQGQAAVGTTDHDLGGGVGQGQAVVQRQGARRAAAAAVGIEVKLIRQTVEGAVKGDAASRAVAAEAHLGQQGGAAVAALEKQLDVRRLRRQLIALPVGGTVPGSAQAAGAAIPDHRCGRAGPEAEQGDARAKAKNPRKPR